MENDGTAAEARRPGTPIPRLRELAEQEPWLARIVASRIGLPADLAEEIAARAAAGEGDSWAGVLRAVAAQPATSADRLALLATHPDPSVRGVVAVHRSTPKSALKLLAADGSVAVRRALAARERLPRRLAERLLVDASGDVRLTMARRIDAQPEQLRSLAGDPDPRVRRVVAALGHAGGADLSDPDPVVRRNAVRSRDFAGLGPVLADLARDEDPGVRALAAEQHRNEDPVSLAVLAEDREPSVRIVAAGNWFTPVEQLTALAADPDLRVLCALSDNEFAPPQTLARLVETVEERYADAVPTADDPSDGVRRLVVNLLDHQAAPPESLRRLHALRPCHFHPGNAMSQPNWPGDMVVDFGLEYCASTIEGEAERASFAEVHAARHGGRLTDALCAMVRSPVYYLRAAVANRHVPAEVLAEFARTADRELDGYHLDDLAANPALPLEVQLDWANAGERCSYLLRNPELPEPVLRVLSDQPDEAFAARHVLAVRAHREGTEESC
jgi:hypothetical protein